MNLLLTLAAEYRKNRLINWITKKLSYVELPWARLKLLELRQMVFSLKNPTLDQVRNFEDRFSELISQLCC